MADATCAKATGACSRWLLLQGCAVDEIGRRMALSHKTVANCQTVIRQKLGASTGIELLRVAQRFGLAPP